jgi:hypothetical protein
MAKEGRQYIVVVSFYDYSNDRLADAGRRLIEALESVSTEKIEMAFRSVAYDIIAYFVRSRISAHQIRAAIESPHRGRTPQMGAKEGFLTNEDQLLVIELGDDKDATQGLSRALTWLQRH